MNTVCFMCDSSDYIIYTNTTFVCKKCRVIINNCCEICGKKCNNKCLEIFNKSLTL